MRGDFDEDEDQGAYLWERCYECGHRLRFSATGCPQCGIMFKGEPDPEPWPDNCECERCTVARATVRAR